MGALQSASWPSAVPRRPHYAVHRVNSAPRGVFGPTARPSFVFLVKSLLYSVLAAASLVASTFCFRQPFRGPRPRFCPL